MARSPATSSHPIRPVHRTVVLALTVVLMIATSLPNVPRAWLDYSSVPVIGGLQRYETYGNDTIADMYEARVVLADPLDMYTKSKTDQTPLEAATWSKEASAPYPPVALLAMAGLSAVGGAIGIGYYGMVLLLAATFLGLSFAYFLRTRWYLFPLLYLNFGYLSDRFVHVQDGSYLLMLVVVMAALQLARASPHRAHALMAVATTMKLSPLFYLTHVGAMRRPMAATYLAILVVGLVLPYFVLDNYLYIYQYGYELRGSWSGAAASLAVAGLFAVLIAYVGTRHGFDWEDRIGWSLVPVALFFALKLNAPRHLLLVLLVPDKRGLRNVAAAVAMFLPALAPSAIRFGAAGPIAAVILLAGLLVYVRRTGWDIVRDDLRHPWRTAQLMLSPPAAYAGRPSGGG
jgi:hypothetical protein